MPEAAHPKAEDALPVSVAGIDKAGADAEEGVDQAKAAGKKGAATAKQGLNEGLDKVSLSSLSTQNLSRWRSMKQCMCVTN